MRIPLCSLALLCLLTQDLHAAAPPDSLRNYLRFSDNYVALRHVRVIDGNGGPALEDRTLVVRDGKINAILDGQATPPAGAHIEDLRGFTVLPGLVGMHDHLMYAAAGQRDDDNHQQPPGYMLAELAFSAPRLYLANGVTTIRTTGSIEPETDLNLRRRIDALEIPGPHIDVTGPYLEGRSGNFPQMHWSDDAAETRKTVAYWAGRGATSFKAYTNLGEQALAAAIDEAHRHGTKITGHLCAVDYRRAITLGIDNLEHGPIFSDSEFVPNRQPDICPGIDEIAASWDKRELNSPAVQELIQELITHHVAITSTLAVFESDIATRPVLPRNQARLLWGESLSNYRNARSSVAAVPGLSANFEASLKQEMAFERAFVAAGGLLLSGPDPTGNGGVLPGFGDLRGVQLLVEAGFAPVQAIQIASANGARYMGRFDQIGSIEPGKHADFFAVRGDPSRNINDIGNVELVFKDGIAFDSRKLIESVRGVVGIR